MQITRSGAHLANSDRRRNEQGAIIVYFIILIIIAAAVGGVGAYVAQTTYLTHRRSDMIQANQSAIGGAVVACADLKAAYTTNSGTFPANLTSISGYTLSSTLSTSAQKVYLRSLVNSPFTNQTVAAQIWVPNVSSPTTAKVVASATFGKVTQQATVNLRMAFAYPAAIISVNDGTTSASVGKSVAQDGNVVVSGAGSGPLIVDGNQGLAVMANGMVNVDNSDATVAPGSISATNRNTANEIADITGQGTNALFDFGRFIATANATTNIYNLKTHNNHFTNVLSFATAISNSPNHTVEGVVVVDIKKSDNDYSKAGDPSLFPYGINVHGTLFYNFGPEFGITDKFVVTADLNVNAANLSSLVGTNPTSYPSGYPPVYTDPTKNPTNINIYPTYQNFTIFDDLPALMYNIGEVDIHGNANVSGVCYTPSYMEIENKKSGQTQYFKGSLIMGNGIYYENNDKSTSIISFDAAAIDSLATLRNMGKSVFVTFWQ